MAGQNVEGDPFTRRSMLHEREGADPFENMREQMEKERENFFRGVNPRDWPNEAPGSRGGVFDSRRMPTRTSLGGFPAGGGLRGAGHATHFPADDGVEGIGLVPGARQRKSSCGPGLEDEGSDHSSSSGQSAGQDQESIPIHVVHERGPKDKLRHTSRNTTELPAKASGGSESPRLERAASEPPNKFAQRLNLAKPSYSTIPEGGESKGGTIGRPSQLQDPRGPEPTRPGSIKPSASAPSVPTHESHQPVPPPRKSPPRPNTMTQPGVPTNSSNNVRHIPIFVEGRPEPIFNTNLQVGAAEQPAAASDTSLPKPSDYYPQGVQRLKSKDATLTPETSHFHGEPFKSGRTVVPIDEPTTPLGPPPGPIPMGYIPPTSLQTPEEPKEPTTPLGPPPGPIPMGYVPNSGDQEIQPPPPPQRTKSSSNIMKEQLLVPQDTNREVKTKERSPSPGVQASSRSSTLTKEKSAPTEVVVNVVPIRVEGASSQEAGPGRSPTPARGTPQPPTDSPVPSANPKVQKLSKINMEVEELIEKIKNFSGTKQDKEYLFLDEMLTRHLIALDGIEPEGQSEIRQMRKESIKSVNMCLSLLDERCGAPS